MFHLIIDQMYSNMFQFMDPSRNSNLYINLACLSVCLGVCLFVSNKSSKRLNRSGPNFLWDITWPQGRFMNDQN